MKKKVLPILLVVLLLLVGSTEVFASESSRTMQFVTEGDDVVRLQQELQDQGYYDFHVDGIYGLITERAVIDFQIDTGIRIDGIAGPETQSTLFASTNNTTEATSSSGDYDSDDLYWLARIIEAEAGGEPYNGKVAVGNVVLNRVASNDFPDTIYNVIFEYYKSIPQFSPVQDGTIYNTPSTESVNAAKDALNGVRPVEDSTYFFNADKAAGTWIVNNKTYLMKIGGHTFYN